MPPRTLASLAHALVVARSTDAAICALADTLADVDRSARIAVITIDERRQLLKTRLLGAPAGVASEDIDTTLDHLPSAELKRIAAGGAFVDFGETSDEYARLFHLPPLGEPGLLAARGICLDGALLAIVVLYETKKLFGTRATERMAPAVGLFDLAFLRFQERDARLDAVRTLEDITRRVHDDYETELRGLEDKLRAAPVGGADGDATARVVALERDVAHSREELRRATRRAEAVDATVGAAVGELEKAHVELHRRSEQLRQKTRTLYLIERALETHDEEADPRALAEALLALVSDDMQAHRCSLMLRTPGEETLFIAAARGIAPGIETGRRTPVGEGVSGIVAAKREPLLVQDVSEADSQALRRDEYFTTGSFISFPLECRGELVGVVNLANRAQQAVFVEEDVDRVRLLGFVIALIAVNASLAQRLTEAMRVG